MSPSVSFTRCLSGHINAAQENYQHVLRLMALNLNNVTFSVCGLLWKPTSNFHK